MQQGGLAQQKEKKYSGVECDAEAGRKAHRETEWQGSGRRWASSSRSVFPRSCLCLHAQSTLRNTRPPLLLLDRSAKPAKAAFPDPKVKTEGSSGETKKQL